MTHLSIEFGDICETETLGFSGEGRAIRALKIGSFDGTKPMVFFEAGIHAREWIAPMTAVYVMQQLVENSASHNLLDELDFIIIPVTNPDGYEYSHASVSDICLNHKRSFTLPKHVLLFELATTVEKDQKSNS